MCFLIRLLPALTFLSTAFGEAPLANRQIPDVETLPDLTEELNQLIAESGGNLSPAAGVYRITGPLKFDLEQKHSAIIRASDGPVTIIMDGPGPAIRIRGSHDGTASPKTFSPATWNERMPIIEGIEIVGNHPEADGIELVRCV